MKHTRLITVLLISFLIMILVTGFSPVAAGFFGFICLAACGVLLILSFPLASFIDSILTVQLLN